MSIITFIIIITILIFVHELGHFIAAKRSGIRVDEFAIGFPPKIYSWFKGGTKYSLNIIPFGGFVKIFGENPDEESIDGPDKERSFVHKKKSIQAMVLVAGIAFNLIFAWGLFSLGFLIGVPQNVPPGGEGKLFVTEIVKESPAENAGILPGDVLRKLSLGDKTLEQNLNPDNVHDFIEDSKGAKMQAEIERGGKIILVDVSANGNIVKNSYAIGIAMALVSNSRLPIHKALWEGLITTIGATKDISIGIWDLIKNAFTFSADLSQVSGPVGIVGMVGDASRFGLGYLLSFTAMISINLAVINLVPFPALDGGRLLFVLIEAIIRKPISPKITNTLNIAGFLILITFMIAITFSDVMKLF